jgi:hypothetical protein
MTLEEAVLKLEGMPEFEFIYDILKHSKDTNVADLSNMANAENPQLLAYLAGGISVLNILIEQIDECRSEEKN